MNLLTNDVMHEHARHYLASEFGSTWTIDGAKLSEWLAQNNFIFAGLTDEDEIEQAINEFRKELDRVVRQAIQDYQWAEEVVATSKKLEQRMEAA